MVVYYGTVESVKNHQLSKHNGWVKNNEWISEKAYLFPNLR